MFGEVERRTYLERCDERVVSVEVGDDLEATAEADDLPLDVLLEDPVAGISISIHSSGHA